MKVYILWDYGDYYGPHYMGTFSSPAHAIAKAEESIRDYNPKPDLTWKQTKDRWDAADFRVETVVVDQD